MDFFEHQEQARKKTHVLVLYFILAVVGVVASVCVVVSLVLTFASGEGEQIVQSGKLFQWEVVVPCIIATIVVIFAGSGYKTMQLSAGGKVVATELGGRLLSSSSTDFYEQRLINIVEEMAIASGVPVPEVYVMDNEDSINAFAAGKSTSDAVIGVTRGCMKLLSRDELQGVIAHEFSHILNGDMRLNMRLIGWLFGILFIAMIGQMLLRGASFSGRSRSRDSGNGALVMLGIGLALIIIGYIGMFFAKLIKAAVSRQREFLADASAVQFTRNPDGIAGALKKIGGYARKSAILHPMAEEASHMFFGSSALGRSFATHPPLDVRIKRIDQSWDGKLTKVVTADLEGDPDDLVRHGLKKRPVSAAAAGIAMAHNQNAPPLKMSEAEAIESMSSVHREQVDLGQDLHGRFPEHWYQAAHNESGAQALVFALLLAQDDSLRNAELSQLRQTCGEGVYKAAMGFHEEIRDIHSAVKIALIDLAIPTLRRLSPNEYTVFRQTIEHLMASDRQIDLFEFSLQKIIRRHLDIYFGHKNPMRIRYRKIGALEKEAAILVTTLAAVGNKGKDAEMQAAFRHGAREIEGETYGTLEFQPPENCGLQSIDEALDRFAESTPLVKKRLLFACGRTVMADEHVTSDEAEMIRAIADSIGCPIPPFVKTDSIGLN